jgi:hypothetical protein
MTNGGVPPPATVMEGGSAPSDGDSVYIRRLYLPFTLRRSNLTAGAPGSTFFFALNPDLREIGIRFNTYSCPVFSIKLKCFLIIVLTLSSTSA